MARGYLIRKQTIAEKKKAVLGIVLAPLSDNEYQWKDSMATNDGAVYTG